jgi:iron complex transport system substrate-binding protein
VRLLFLIPPLLMLLASCSDGDESPSPPPPTAEPTASAEAAASSPQPISITGDDGETVTLESPPRRIVSLASHATEIFCAIGAGEELVAVEQFANCPAGSDEKPAVDAFQPSVEAIVAYDPDFVYAWYDPGDLVQSLRDAGVTVFFLGVPEDIDGLFDNILLIGEITGRDNAAETLVSEMKTERDSIVASIADVEDGPRIFHESDPSLYTARSDTFVGELYALLKAQNIADAAESPYPQLSSEAVVAADPEVIVLADLADPAEVAARPGWSAISAVANDRICPVNPDLTDRPGPNIMQGLAALADCLYPER